MPARNPQRRLQGTLRQRGVAASLACDQLAADAPQLGDEHAHLRVAHFAEQPRDERQRVTVAADVRQRLSHHHGGQQSKQANAVQGLECRLHLPQSAGQVAVHRLRRAQPERSNRPVGR